MRPSFKLPSERRFIHGVVARSPVVRMISIAAAECGEPRTGIESIDVDLNSRCALDGSSVLLQGKKPVAFGNSEFDHGDSSMTLELRLRGGIQHATQILWTLNRIPERLRGDANRKGPKNLLHLAAQRRFFQKHAQRVHTVPQLREPHG